MRVVTHRGVWARDDNREFLIEFFSSSIRSLQIKLKVSCVKLRCFQTSARSFLVHCMEEGIARTHQLREKMKVHYIKACMRANIGLKPSSADRLLYSFRRRPYTDEAFPCR